MDIGIPIIAKKTAQAPKLEPLSNTIGDIIAAITAGKNAMLKIMFKTNVVVFKIEIKIKPINLEIKSRITSIKR